MDDRSLRPHQREAIKLLRMAIVMGRRRPMLMMPTGAGKTRCASALTHGALAKGRRVIFVVPSISLIDQTVERFAEDGITCVGVIQADHDRTDPDQPVQVASVQTLMNRAIGSRVERAKRLRSVGVKDLDGRTLYEDVLQDDGTTKRRMVRESVEKTVDLEPIPDADLVIIDEAHVSFSLYARWMDHPRWAHVPFIGLSATPGTKGLGRVYNDLIRPISIQELIDQGYLSPFRVFAPSHPDLSQVRVRAGEFVEEDVAAVMDRAPLTADIVDNWVRNGNNEPTFCFCVNRLHAAHIEAQFNAAGVSAAYVDAFTSREERRAIFERFRSGEVKVICNVDCLSKGVDEDVRCLIMARPTRSTMWFIQCVGRVLRTAHGKYIATVFDHSDNHLRLGFVTDITFDHLDDGTKPIKETKKETEDRLPKECPSCHALRPPRVKACPACGFEAKPKSDVACEDGELVELKQSPRKGEKVFTQEERQALWSMFLGLQQERGKRDGYASHLYKDKTGSWPRGLVDFPLPPNDEVKRFVTHRNMRRAFGKAKARA